ncbi:hypothetical protein AAC387_Pa07g1359 [Persea americana]
MGGDGDGSLQDDGSGMSVTLSGRWVLRGDGGMKDWRKEWFVIAGSIGFKLYSKLLALKINIKKWNREVFGRIDESREALSKFVENLDLEGERRELSPEEVEHMKDTLRRIWDLNHMEEISWRQKSRVSWLKEGDKNTRFFHWMVSSRSKINFVGRIRKCSRILESPHEVKGEVARLFETLYTDDFGARPKLEGLSFPSISLEDRSWLERAFEEEEVLRALEECGGDMAPGPDGFNFSFIKAGWGFLEEDYKSMLSEFHLRGRISKEMNATFLTLIPKVPNQIELKDYRPISLVGCLYKLLAKILANCLKKALPSIISPFQGAFVAGRQNLDGVLVANELIDSRKRSKKEGVIFKIDLEKAYDHVDWGGIRQGDPLSPFLFTIVVEALSLLLLKAKELGIISGFEIGHNGETITHLQFANDTILFTSSNREEVLALRRILCCFQLVSRLKVNISTSLLVGIGCSKESTKELADIIGCKAGRLPILYLGLPIGAKQRSKLVWDPVIANFERKLSSWKKQYLSLGGRITLINSCLSNLPVYYMSLFRMPKMVIERLDCLRRDFLWEGQGNKKRLHLVKWSEVIKPKKNGGLGIANLEKKWALFAKWWWRFGEEKEALWRRLIASNHCKDSKIWKLSSSEEFSAKSFYSALVGNLSPRPSSALVWMGLVPAKEMNDRIFKRSSLLLTDLVSRITLRIVEWALVRKEFSNFSLNDILLNWEACMGCGFSKVRRSIPWSPPPIGVLKFNVDGASSGKPGPACIGGVLRNFKGKVLIMFSKHIRICDSNEVEVLAILEAFHLFPRDCFEPLIVESNSSNAIAWVSNRKTFPWKFQFHFNEIKELSSSLNVEFHREVRSANSMVDFLAKKGWGVVDRFSPWVGMVL